MEKNGGQSGDVHMIADIIRDANSGSLLWKGGEFSELILAWLVGLILTVRSAEAKSGQSGDHSPYILPVKDLHLRDLECHVSSELVSSVPVSSSTLSGTAHEVHAALMPDDDESVFLFSRLCSRL